MDTGSTETGKGEGRGGLPPRLLPLLAAAFYLVLTVAGGIWIRYQPENPLADQEIDPIKLTRDLGIGLAAGLLVVILSRVLVGISRMAGELESGLAEAIGPLRETDILLLALLSGFGEEIFFRGALQPVVGIWIASLLFGLLHLTPGKFVGLWSVFAFGMGLLLGFLFEWTGGLLAPATTHFVVNFLNLARMQRLYGEGPSEEIGEE